MIANKTALGAQVMKDRSMSLTAQQRSALILCDGKRLVEEVLRMTAGVGVSMKDVDALASKGLIEVTLPETEEQKSLTSKPPESAQESQNLAPRKLDFRQTRDMAIKICADLGFKGFSVNIAVVDAETMDQLKKLAPEIRRLAGDAKYRPLHEQLFGQAL